ncbi:MAG TPA: ACP S-malonyltransferase, partial [Chloroflexota bacterium]
MGASLSGCSAAARELFAVAERATQLPLAEVCFEGPADRLTDTAFAQPGVVAVSLAAAAALDERLSELGVAARAAMCAGHSVGEYSALGYSGALTVSDALKLVSARGKAMAEASSSADGSMVAVLGLDEEPLARVCSRASEETGASVQVANLNAPGQIVISGSRRALDRACELAKEAGAKRAVALDVSGPFHSIYMQPAADLFRGYVDAAPVAAPSVPVVLNVNARPSADPVELRRE